MTVFACNPCECGGHPDCPDCGVAPEIKGLIEAEDRFWSKVEQGGRPDSCWEWFGEIDPYGYGKFWAGGKNWRAHRASVVIATRKPIPEGGQVCHHCDNKRCVRPTHLYVGSHADNMRDRDERNLTAVGERHGCAKLTDAQVLEIRELRGTYPSRVIAERFGVTQDTINSILAFRTWRHIGSAMPEVSPCPCNGEPGCVCQ